MSGLWVLTLLLIDVALQPANQSSTFCECLSVDAAANGLAQIRRANWQQTDQTEIEKLWPRVPVLPCQTGQQLGLGPAADYLARCCEACELCGGVSFEERVTGASFRLVDIWLSRQTFDSAQSTLRTLTTAALPEDSKPTSASHSDSRVIDGYSWDSEGTRFQMRVDAIASGGVWVGHFQVGRCSSPGPTETLPIGGDKVIRVRNAEAAERPGQGTVLSVWYSTQCLLEDRRCWNAELDQLWPSLRSVAGGRTIATVDVEVEDCLGGSVSFQSTRTKDGNWSGLWTPANR